MKYISDYSVTDTQRFCPPAKHTALDGNVQFFGLWELISELRYSGVYQARMIEIGGYMGESTAMFGMSGLFQTIHCIDPFEGDEGFNEEHDYDWDFIQEQFTINTRHYNDKIIHHKEFSENIFHKFEDESFDFIYVDGNHSYEAVKRDLENYLPKIKNGGFIGGHDYLYPRKRHPKLLSSNVQHFHNCTPDWASGGAAFPGCVEAIKEVVGRPTRVFEDSSWIKRIER